MPTVIDSLVVELGLDPTNFTKGQKEAAQAFLKTRDEAKRTGDDIEHSSGKAEQMLSKVRGGAIALFAAFAGARSITEFVEKNTKLNAETGRTAAIFDTTTQKLSAWRGMAERSGSSAEAITGVIGNLVNEMQRFDIEGESSVVPWFRTLQGMFPDINLNLKDSTGKMRDFQEVTLDLSEALHRMATKDPAQAAYFARQFGATDSGTITMLLQGKAALSQSLEEQKKLRGVTEEDAKAAQELTKQWNETAQASTRLGNSILTWVTPGLIAALKGIRSVINPEHWAGGLPDEAGAYGTGDAPTETTPASSSSAPSKSSFGGVSDKIMRAAMAGFIVEEAQRQGVDPKIALAVAQSEGLNKYVGDQGTSFGAFQLHYKNNIPGLSNGGLGDTFTKQTGLDARNPETERDQVKFAIGWAKTHGWSAWHGWKGDPWAGIPTGSAAGAAQSNSSGGPNSSSTVSIGKIDVHTTGPQDANSIAGGISSALTRQLANQANAGPS